MTYKENYLENLKWALKEKGAAYFISVFERDQNKLLNKVNRDERSEIEMMVAFAYFELEKFEASRKYGMIVIENLRSEKVLDKAQELFVEMSIISLVSLQRLKKPIMAYLFLFRVLRMGLSKDARLIGIREDIISKVSLKIITIFNFLLPGFVFGVVIYRHAFLAYSSIYYIMFLSIMLVLVYCFYQFSNFFLSGIQRLLSYFIPMH